VSFLTREYPVRSWRMVGERINRLPPVEQRALWGWAESAGFAAALRAAAG
jgi:hypothetical protein